MYFDVDLCGFYEETSNHFVLFQINFDNNCLNFGLEDYVITNIKEKPNTLFISIFPVRWVKAAY